MLDPAPLMIMVTIHNVRGFEMGGEEHLHLRAVPFRAQSQWLATAFRNRIRMFRGWLAFSRICKLPPVALRARAALIARRSEQIYPPTLLPSNSPLAPLSSYSFQCCVGPMCLLDPAGLVHMIGNRLCLSSSCRVPNRLPQVSAGHQTRRDRMVT